MKIISKFQDYYDGVQSYGHDATLTYVRKSKEISSEEFKEQYSKIFDVIKPILLPRSIHSEPLTTKYLKEYMTFYPFLVAFCGKFYIGMQYTSKSHTKYDHETKIVMEIPETTYTFYNNTEIKEFLESDDKYKYTLKRFLETVDDYKPSYIKKWHQVQKNTAKYAGFEKVFNKISKLTTSQKTKLNELFVLYHTPAFVLKEGCNTIINPCLKDYAFFKKHDPFSAFQEIDMYLGGVLGADAPEMITIGDEDMKCKKGFDDYSFKTRPTKKRI